MADTRGFDVVAELTPAVLLQMMQAAWTSGGPPGPGVIPQNFDTPAGTAIGPYQLADGQVQIPFAGLDLSMAPDVNGVDMKFELDIQVTVQNPPVPSATMFSMTSDVHAKVPVGLMPGSNVNVGILLGGLPRANVTAALTSGDPITSQLDTFITEYVHQSYAQNGPSFPHTIAQTNQSMLAYTVDATAQLFDDATDPTHAITVARAGSQLTISIPVHLRIFNIVRTIPFAPNLFDPMGVEARMVITANNLTITPGQVSANLSTATVTTQGIVAAPAIYGQEGPNYVYNKAQLAGIGVDLDSVIAAQLAQQGQGMLAAMAPIAFSFPTVPQIEQAIGDAFWQQLVAAGAVSVWTPQSGAGTGPVAVTDVTVKALADALAIALNQNPGADANALGAFVPAGMSFAIAMRGGKVLDIVQASIHRPESAGGFGTTFPHPPHRFHNVQGHDVDLTRLDPSLTSAIHFSGDVTVINAILGSIDVDASFDVDIGLHWADSSPGPGQMLVPDTGSPDVHLSGLAWLLSILIGFVTFGVVGVIIAVVILEVVTGIAQHIGSDLASSAVAGQVSGIGAWPANLQGIGTVNARFENPVGISPDGLLFMG